MGKTTTIVDTDVIPATTETPSDDNIINCNTATCIKDKILSSIVVETAKTRSAHQNQATQNEVNTELFHQSKRI